MNEKKTNNGIDIVKYGDVTNFTNFDEVKKEDERKHQEELYKKARWHSSWFGNIVNWFKTSKVTPYVNTRDLADPFGNRNADWTDIDAGSDGKTSVSIGIKVKF